VHNPDALGPYGAVAHPQVGRDDRVQGDFEAAKTLFELFELAPLFLGRLIAGGEVGLDGRRDEGRAAHPAVDREVAETIVGFGVEIASYENFGFGHT
jgi:hypothetical protein